MFLIIYFDEIICDYFVSMNGLDNWGSLMRVRTNNLPDERGLNLVETLRFR